MQCNKSLHYCRRKINEGRMRLSARIFGRWHIQTFRHFHWTLNMTNSKSVFFTRYSKHFISTLYLTSNIEINHVRVVSANLFFACKSFSWVIFSRETCSISLVPVHIFDLRTMLLFCTIWFCRPVMHNFFLERFAQASDWFEKRLAYTRSVATSSMVSHFDFTF